MRKTLAELAQIVRGEVVGDKDLVITGLNGILEAQEGQLTFLANLKYKDLLQTTQASAIVAPRNTLCADKSMILADNPSLAFSQIASLYVESVQSSFQGIHESAVIAPTVAIGKNVTVGPCAVIEDNVTVGDNTVIGAGVFLGQQTTIGEDCLIYPNVTVCKRISIADRVIIHSGTVIGSDGFGFEPVEGSHQKIPQIGTVIIESDVEIGSNVSIDRARFDKTVIGRGTKIDNLVQIAHNVIVGENTIIVSQVGISGSTKIGKNVIIAGQVGVAGHLNIGDGSIVAAKSGVAKSMAPYSKVFGIPAVPHIEAKRAHVAMQKLPDYLKRVKMLEDKVDELEKKLRDKS